MIYLDHSATSFPKIKEVKQAVLESMDLCGNAARSMSKPAMDASYLIYETRVLLAKYFHVSDSSKVIINSGNTESLNTIIKGILKPGDHVITTYAEHNSVLRPLYQLERDQHIQITLTNPDVKSIEQAILENTKMIIVTHSSNVTGEVYPIRDIGKLAHEKGILMVSDVAQSAGHIDIDMVRDHLDIITFSGHKGLLGIQGIGGFCIEGDIAIEPLISGGVGHHSYDHFQMDTYPERVEAGTRNLAGIASLKAGITYLLEHQSNINQHNEYLTKILESGLKSIESVILYSSTSQPHTPIVAFNIGSRDSQEIEGLLNLKYGVACRAGVHCAPKMHEHLGTVNQGVVRLSVGLTNTLEQINQVIQIIQEIVKEGVENDY